MTELRFSPALFASLAKDAGKPCGILFGSVEGQLVRLIGAQPLREPAECEAALSAANPPDGALACGWYRVQRAGHPVLPDADRATFDACFPGRWQVVLLAIEGDSGSRRVFVFYRGPDGTVYQKLLRTESEPAKQLSSAPVSRLAALLGVLRRPWVFASLAIILVAGGTAFGWNRGLIHPFGSGASPPAGGLRLEMAQNGASLEIRWREAPMITGAESGTLDITDGGFHALHIPLSVKEIESGTYAYVQRSDVVTATLSVERKKGPPVRQSTLFVASAVPSYKEAPVPVAAPAKTSEETAVLRARLEEEQVRNRRLEALVALLRAHSPNQIPPQSLKDTFARNAR